MRPDQSTCHILFGVCSFPKVKDALEHGTPSFSSTGADYSWPISPQTALAQAQRARSTSQAPLACPMSHVAIPVPFLEPNPATLGSSETETLESAWANQKGTLAPGAHGDDDNDRRTLRAVQTSGVGLGQVFTKGASFVNGFLFWGILELCQIPRLSNPPVIS